MKKFDIEQFQEKRILEYFKDIDTDTNELIENAILKFCIENKVNIEKNLEERLLLKQLIKLLKNEYKIKYAEIMERLSIPISVIKSLK